MGVKVRVWREPCKRRSPVLAARILENQGWARERGTAPGVARSLPTLNGIAGISLAMLRGFKE